MSITLMMFMLEISHTYVRSAKVIKVWRIQWMHWVPLIIGVAMLIPMLVCRLIIRDIMGFVFNITAPEEFILKTPLSGFCMPCAS
jgi:hypothetical protein